MDNELLKMEIKNQLIYCIKEIALFEQNEDMQVRYWKGQKYAYECVLEMLEGYEKI